jgi:hypothetical protein
MNFHAISRTFAGLVALVPIAATAEILLPQKNGPIEPYRVTKSTTCTSAADCIIKLIRVPAGRQLRIDRIDCDGGSDGFVLFVGAADNPNNLQGAWSPSGGVASSTGPYYFAENEVPQITTIPSTNPFACVAHGILPPTL